MRTLFISDCHLDPQNPRIIDSFQKFLHDQVPNADQLYILGDLFEYWIGNHHLTPPIKQVIDNLRTAAKQTPIYFLHGNRDFLIDQDFAEQTGCVVLNQPLVIDLHGTDTLIMHGDLLCSDDRRHQWFRRLTQNPVSKGIFNCLSHAMQLRIAQRLRCQSTRSAEHKLPEIMDVNKNTVARYMQRFRVTQLIHGHTHRPQIHSVELPDTVGKRVVLGAWEQGAEVLSVDGGTLTLAPADTI